MHRIGPCRIEAILSRSGQGLVCKGFHEGLNRPAVIRALGAVNPDERERLRLDAQAQLRLQHSSIAALYDFIEDQGQVFVASESVEGPPLDALLRETGIPWKEALSLFEQVLAALEHAHRNGVIHRDIQPANVRVSEGRVKVTGFALGSVGNPAYMAPEQSLSAEIDPRTDVYSAAVVLYEMLAGRPPFQGGTDLDWLQGHLGEVPADLKELVPDLPGGVSAAVAIALQKDPRQRFQTAADFLRSLEEGVAGFLPAPPQPVPVPPTPAFPVLETPEVFSTPPPPPASGRDGQRRRRLVAASWVVLGLDLLGSYGLWKTADRPPRLHSSVTPGTPSLSAPVTPAPELSETVAEKVPRSPDPEDPVSSKTERVEKTLAGLERAAPSPVAEVAGPDPEEIRRREVDRVRDEVRQGIERAEADLQNQKLDAVQEQLDRLMSQAQRYPADLSEEITKVRDLRKGVTDALVAAQTQLREEALKRAEWERRLEQIKKLMEQGKYPEADNLARGFADEPGISETVAAQALELSNQAREELKKIFGDTRTGSTQNKVRKPPSHRERKMEP